MMKLIRGSGRESKGEGMLLCPLAFMQYAHSPPFYFSLQIIIILIFSSPLLIY